MNRGIIDQMTGFMYLGEDNKFRKVHPSDYYKGIKLSNEGKVRKTTHSGDIVNSKTYSAEVGSISNWREPFHYVAVRNAHDPELVESTCGCEKEKKLRFTLEIWLPSFLKEWKISDKRHYFAESSCPHKSALDIELRKENVFCFGIRDGMEKSDFYEKYKILKQRLPKKPDYVLDYIILYETSLFKDAEQQVNEMRKKHGLNELKIYHDKKFKEIVKDKIGISNEEIRKAVLSIT